MDNRAKALIANIIIVLTEISGFIWHFLHEKETFRYYTQDSNLFSLIASAAFALWLLKNLKTKAKVPMILRMLRYMGATALSLTFLVVLLILAPANGANGHYIMMFSKWSSFCFHTLCPILSFISFCFLEKHEKLTMKDNFIVIVPTCIYAVVLLIMNAARIIEGPYFFFHIYEQPVWTSIMWLIVIVTFDFLIGLAIRKIAVAKR